MEILVISDTHGNLENIRKVLKKHKDIKNIFHLGDGKADIDLIKDEFKDRVFFRVCGNCDSDTTMPEILTTSFMGKKFLAAHGHKFKVKESLELFVNEAKKQNADIAMFGHTHVPINKNMDGITIFNPGSLEKEKGTYGIVTVNEEEKLVARHLNI